jgi:polysaccharide biosynthesis/export protein
VLAYLHFDFEIKHMWSFKLDKQCFNSGWVRLVLLCGLLIQACVPNKKVVLLQKDEVNRKKVVTDSTIRQYIMEPYEYRIQPFDALYIDFQSLTEEEFDFLQRESGAAAGIGGQTGGLVLLSELVDPQGLVSFPVAGKIKVSGLTIFEAQDSLQALANRYLQNASVRVRLANFRLTILGEVNREGVVNTLNPRITLPEALALAGGLGELADRSRIKIVRQIGDTTQVAYVNLLDENFLSSPFYYVHQNDLVVVSPLRQRPFRRYFTQNVGILLSATSVVLLIINLVNN